MPAVRTHIIKRGDGWAVKKQGTSRASKVYQTQDEAIKNARKMKSSADIVVHRKDGSIRNWIKNN